MDDPEMRSPWDAVTPPCPVADTMRRVHSQLRDGGAPTFEALLAFGEPCCG